MKNNKSYLILISLVGLALFSQTPALVSATPLTWDLEEGQTIVYEVTTISYNNTNWMPMDENGTARIYQGNNLYARISNLPADNATGNVSIIFWASQDSNYQIDYEYSLPLEATWDTDVYQGVLYMCFAMPIYNSTEWSNMESDFNNLGYTVINNDTIFSIEGTNNTANVSSVQGTWEKSSGIMTHYYFDSPNLGPDNQAMTFEFNFKYIQDWDELSQYMSWDVNPDDMAAWRITEIEYNNTDQVPMYSENETQKYMNENDLLIINFNEFNDFSTNSEPKWNGSMFTSTDFLEGEELYYSYDSPTQGPRWWYPIIPTGNDMFWNNITDEVNSAINQSASITNGILNITIDDPDVYESAEFNVDTGLLENYIYDGIMEDEDFLLEMHLVYYLPLSDYEMQWLVPEDFSIRYIANNIQNGSNDFIEMNNGFTLHQGDLASFYFDEFSNFDEELGYNFSMKTSRGHYEENIRIDLRPLGLETFQDGIPGFYPVMPLDPQEGFIDEVLLAYEGVGYDIVNESEIFGYEYTSSEYTVTILWERATGILEFYHLAYDEGDNLVVIDFTRGVDVDPSSLQWNWGISVSDELVYHYKTILMDGQDKLPLDEDVYIHEDESIFLTITHIGDIAEEGPRFNFSMTIGTYTEEVTSMMEEPGFEFYEDENEGFLPFLYVAIPIGNQSWWDLAADLYTEAGYNVTASADVFEVSGISWNMYSFDVKWHKTNGTLLYYHIEAENFELELVPGGGTYVPPVINSTTTPTNATSTTSGEVPELSPGFELFYVLPVFAIIVVYFRKHR
ncbi:MAG: hypothetical protein ACTSWJ_04610 [Candidatus Heimdallarchaeaceae archaeon]